MTHRPRIGSFLACSLLAGCIQARDLIEPVAQARADAVAEEALVAVQASVGMAAVGAFLCGYTLESWQDMGTEAPTLPDDVAAWFGIDEPGALRSYPARGQYELTWGGATFFGQDVALSATVATPMTALTVSIVEAGLADDTGSDEDTGGTAEATESLASAALATTGCGGEDHLVAGTVSFPISGDYGWTTTLVGAEATAETEDQSKGEDEDGMAFEVSAAMPARGTLTWSGTTNFGRASLLTDDASTIAEGLWPATVSGRDWDGDVSLALQ